MHRNLIFYSCWVCRRHGASLEIVLRKICDCRGDKQTNKQTPLFSLPCSTVFESPTLWIWIIRISAFRIAHFHTKTVNFCDCFWRIGMKPRDLQICLLTFLLFGSQLSAQSSSGLWPTVERGTSHQTQLLQFSAFNRHRPYQMRSRMLNVMTRRSVTS